MSAPPLLFQRIDRVLIGEVSLGDFEQWVYTSPDLESEIGSKEYHELLAFDYRQSDAKHEFRKLLETIYNARRPGMLVRDRVWRLACLLRSGPQDFARTVGELASLWYGGYKWIPADFAGIDSELDDIPHPAQYPLWDPAALEVKRPQWESHLDHLRAAAAAAAADLLVHEFPDLPCA